MTIYPTIESTIGKPPLVALTRLAAAGDAGRGNALLAKLEGNNPAGSVKDRAALAMIDGAQRRGEISPGDTLIEATSGNTGIALAMVAAVKGYHMVLVMPEDLSVERAQTMKAYGAELILTPKSGGMEYARDLALQMAAQGKGRVLDQFANKTIPGRITKRPALKSGSRRKGASRISSAPWAPRARSPAWRAFCVKRTPRCASWARSPPRARAFPAYANGPRNTCPRSIGPNSPMS